MYCFLVNLVGAVTALGLIVTAFIYMVCPKEGGEMLKRLAVFVVGALFGLCLLRQFAAYIGPLALLLFGFATCVAAYLIREAYKARPARTLGHRGAERTPVLPPDAGEEEERS